MASCSAHVFSPPKALIPYSNPIHFAKIPRLLPLLNHFSRRPFSLDSTSAVAEFRCRSTASTAPTSTSLSSPDWVEFAQRVSGEWDGFCAEFTEQGDPIELPENVVPEAFREWGVQVFDWQTQCPTLADEKGDILFTYKTIKLLPTVGCEADAATRYSVEERVAGGVDNQVSTFVYDSSGSFVAAWPLEGLGGYKILELEHCLMDPRDKEGRIRVIQVIRVEERAMRLVKIRVFSEHWDGPFRNGELLGGCAIRDSGFAATAKVDVSKVVGVWQGTTASVARFQNETKDVYNELVADAPCNSARDHHNLVALPKQLWSLSKDNKHEETLWEVGWLLDNGDAITSRCFFRKNGTIKVLGMKINLSPTETCLIHLMRQEIAVGREIAV